MYDELIKSLREDHGKQYFARDMEAADAIEKLLKARDAACWGCKCEKLEPACWIPVTERLPEKNGSYLVYVYGEVTEMNFWRGKWHRLGDDYTKAVTHWMPLPSTEGLNET